MYAEALRDEQAKVLRTIKPVDVNGVDRGRSRGYRDEPDVAKDSPVATYTALKLHVESWRWSGVPFFVRAGKQLKMTATEVFVELKVPPQVVFPEAPPSVGHYVRFRVSPQVAIAIGARAKRAGEAMTGEPIELVVSSLPKRVASATTSASSGTPCPATLRSSRVRTSSRPRGPSSIR